MKGRGRSSIRRRIAVVVRSWERDDCIMRLF
jgi:hypothetical protein